MIVLDTNVISELMIPEPDPGVVSWMNSQSSLTVWTTAITIYEIRFGLQSMPEGKKRSALLDLFERWLNNVIQRRIAAFDHAAAQSAADLAAAGKAAGRPRDPRDTMIAGIVLANHATLATRNVRHFEDIAERVVNPWE
ncbi:MAG TPA: type II toxin-antitoxin system VapC family toxin [Bryobacteraceae bacterium]|nr:type II toxin-antitoxin system VapC family toxin [Bryobacteraceae bacterium]